MRKYRILIVDDHPLMRWGLRRLIEQERDLAVCAEAEDVYGALLSAEEHRPDLVIVDLSLKDESGLDLVRLLRARKPRVASVVYSMHEEAVYGERALRAGAKGYLSKQEAVDRVIEAVRRIRKGEVCFSQATSERIVRSLAGGKGGADGFSPDLLSDRELEVFRFIGRGLGTGQIAGRLRLSVKTVEAHRARIKKKLGLENADELRQRAVQWGQRP